MTVRGINVTTQVVSRLSSLGTTSISSMPTGFIVDRVYSCNGPGGDDMMVIEGHRIDLGPLQQGRLSRLR